MKSLITISCLSLKRCQGGSLNKVFMFRLYTKDSRDNILSFPHKAAPLPNYTTADSSCKILWSACFPGRQTPISIHPCLDIRYRLHKCLMEYPPNCTSAERQIVQLKPCGQNLKSCFNYLFRCLLKCTHKDVFISIVDNKSFPSNGKLSYVSSATASFRYP